MSDRFCDNQTRTVESGSGWDCTAHMHEARCFLCQFNSAEEASGKCSDFTPVPKLRVMADISNLRSPIVRFELRLPYELHERLRLRAFTERRSMHKLLLDALSNMLGEGVRERSVSISAMDVDEAMRLATCGYEELELAVGALETIAQLLYEAYVQTAITPAAENLEEPAEGKE